MPKLWLSYIDQVALLRDRGMQIDDLTAAARFLSETNYHRFAGYFRHWQRNPSSGDNHFVEGTSFDRIVNLYRAEESIAMACDQLLHRVEILLRTRFAHAYGRCVGVTGTFAHGDGFTQSPRQDVERVEEHLLSDLDRSKEKFVAHYRDDIQCGYSYKPEAYDRMPIWVAVEALSFGTLSRLIEASEESGVLHDLATSMDTSPKFLPGQVKSFVYLRNRIAHCSQLWNHMVINVAGMQRTTARRAQKRYRNFNNQSIYKTLVALDELAGRADIQKNWLTDAIEPILQQNELLAHGIAWPEKFGDMPPELLIS